MRYFDVVNRKFVPRMPDGDYVVSAKEGKLAFSQGGKVLYACGELEFKGAHARGYVKERHELFGSFEPNALLRALDSSGVTAYGFGEDAVWFEGPPSTTLNTVLSNVKALVRG